MAYGERESGRAAEAVLKEAGFTVSEKCCSRPSCFDFAARKGEKLVFIKVQAELDNFSSKESNELKVISKCVTAASLLISEKTRERPLEDDTVYSRHNVLALTPKTFESIVLHSVNPLIQAGPGGYYVEIDAEALRKRRQELNMSVGEMAEMVSISRRTLYGYERGMAKASVTAAYKLMWALGVPVAKSVNVFKRAEEQRKCFLLAAKRAIAENKLLQKVFRRLRRYNITTVRKAPFDFVINVSEERVRIIGGVANEKEKMLDKRVDEILSVSRVIEAYPVLVTEKRNLTNMDISCIGSQEISKINNLEDLIHKL